MSSNMWGFFSGMKIPFKGLIGKITEHGKAEPI
jgi:hypothetical protein